MQNLESKLNWGDIFVRYERQVRTTAWLILKDDDDVSDVVSMTFETAMRKEHQFDPNKAAINTWLTTISRNFALGILRKRKNIGPLTEDVADVPTEDEDEDRHEILMAAIDSLPASKLKHTWERSREIGYIKTAEELGIPEITVRTRISRFYTLVRACISGEKFVRRKKQARAITFRVEKNIYQQGNRFWVYGYNNGKYGFVASCISVEEARALKDSLEN
jgi:RNA polymerase sigma-70 factor, ECF subfamily